MNTPDIRRAIRDIVAEELRVKASDATDEASLASLGASSSDCLLLVLALGDAFEFNPREDDQDKLTTVGDVITYVENRTKT